MRYISNIAIVILLSSCSLLNNLQFDLFNIVPTRLASGRQIILKLPNFPQFILNIRTDTDLSTYGEEICVEVYEFLLWEVGVDAEELQQYLYDPINIYIILDGKRIEKSQYIYQTALTSTTVTNEAGEILGSFGDIEYCMFVNDLSAGLHDVNFKLRTWSGELLSYSFEFLLK